MTSSSPVGSLLRAPVLFIELILCPRSAHFRADVAGPGHVLVSLLMLLAPLAIVFAASLLRLASPWSSAQAAVLLALCLAFGKSNLGVWGAASISGLGVALAWQTAGTIALVDPSASTLASCALCTLGALALFSALSDGKLDGRKLVSSFSLLVVSAMFLSFFLAVQLHLEGSTANMFVAGAVLGAVVMLLWFSSPESSLLTSPMLSVTVLSLLWWSGQRVFFAATLLSLVVSLLARRCLRRASWSHIRSPGFALASAYATALAVAWFMRTEAYRLGMATLFEGAAAQMIPRGPSGIRELLGSPEVCYWNSLFLVVPIAVLSLVSYAPVAAVSLVAGSFLLVAVPPEVVQIGKATLAASALCCNHWVVVADVAVLALSFLLLRRFGGALRSSLSFAVIGQSLDRKQTVRQSVGILSLFVVLATLWPELSKGVGSSTLPSDAHAAIFGIVVGVGVAAFGLALVAGWSASLVARLTARRLIPASGWADIGTASWTAALVLGYTSIYTTLSLVTESLLSRA